MVSVAEAEQGNGCSSASCSALGGHAHKPERDVPLTLCGTASLMMDFIPSAMHLHWWL